MAGPLDVNEIRKNFPALGAGQIFFDNAGGSQVLGSVIDSISHYLTHTNAQLGGSYPTSLHSAARTSAGLEAAAQYINASPSEVVLGSSTTQLLRNLSSAIEWTPGDELIVSKCDHEANIAPWVDISQRLGLRLIWWTPSPANDSAGARSLDVRLDPTALAQLVTVKTRLVACTHASNILGSISPIGEISKTLRGLSDRALLVVDGVAYAPHRGIDVQALGVDFYAFSWYKVYGPHISLLYGSTRAQKALRTLGHYFQSEEGMGGKLGLAGGSYELVSALPKVVDYFSGGVGGGAVIGDGREGWFKKVGAHESRLAEILLSYLRSRGDVTICGVATADPLLRVPTVSWRVAGWSSREVVEAVENARPLEAAREKQCYGFRWGHFYSKRLCDEVLKIPEDGVIRVSLVHYNTEEEARAFVELFDRVVVRR